MADQGRASSASRSAVRADRRSSKCELPGTLVAHADDGPDGKAINFSADCAEADRVRVTTSTDDPVVLLTKIPPSEPGTAKVEIHGHPVSYAIPTDDDAQCVITDPPSVASYCFAERSNDKIVALFADSGINEGQPTCAKQ